MAYSTPSTRAAGYVVPYTVWNSDVVDNVIALRTGAIALSSQAAGDVIYATTTTQLGRVAIGTSGYVLTSNGSAPAWSNTPTLTGTNITGIPAASILAGTFGSGNYTIPGLLTVSGFGTHTFSAGGTGYQILSVRNTTATATGGVGFYLGNDASSSMFNIFAFSSSQGGSDSNHVVGTAEGAGGLTFKASHASGDVRIYSRNALALTLGASQAASFTGDLSLAATKKLYLDGGSDTYIVESSANVLSTYTGGVNSFGVNSDGPFVIAGKKLFLDSGGDTYITESSGNNISVYCGGAERGGFNTAGVYVNTYPTTVLAANLWSQNGSNIHISTSSIKYKHDIETLDAAHARAAVMAMRPVTYRGKMDEDQRRVVGFIAEEMQQIAPLLCTYDEGGESGTPNYVTYDRVTAYLVAVVQKQQAEIDALKAQKEQK